MLDIGGQLHIQVLSHQCVPKSGQFNSFNFKFYYIQKTIIKINLQQRTTNYYLIKLSNALRMKQRYKALEDLYVGNFVSKEEELSQ